MKRTHNYVNVIIIIISSSRSPGQMRAQVIHPELQGERNYATTWDGRPKLTVGNV
jgi:hypothetical protein